MSTTSSPAADSRWTASPRRPQLSFVPERHPTVQSPGMASVVLPSLLRAPRGEEAGDVSKDASRNRAGRRSLGLEAGGDRRATRRSHSPPRREVSSIRGQRIALPGCPPFPQHQHQHHDPLGLVSLSASFSPGRLIRASFLSSIRLPTFLDTVDSCISLFFARPVALSSLPIQYTAPFSICSASFSSSPSRPLPSSPRTARSPSSRATREGTPPPWPFEAPWCPARVPTPRYAAPPPPKRATAD